MKKLKQIVCMGIGVLLSLCCLCSCGKDSGGKVVFTTAFGEDELFRIGEISCTMPEYMLYLTNMQNEYEDVFGTQIWELTYEDTTLQENVKDIALAQIAQMKSMYLLAKEKEVTLQAGEEERLALAAQEYYNSLSQTEIEAMGISQDMILQLYTEYALAQKVYEMIVSQVNPEISDDEARTVIVEQIVLKTSTKDYEGNVIEYSDATKEECRQKIQEIREMAVSGEYDFTELAGKYSEEDTIRSSLKKGDASPIIEDVVFDLETDEVSEVIESETGYHIIKCISTYDKAQTDANKLVIIEERKKEAFGMEYDAFVSKLARKLNDKLWKSVELIHLQDVKTSSFFEVDNKHFPVN